MSGISVTVVYARPGLQAVRPVKLHGHASLLDALRASGLLEEFPEIDLCVSRTGVFGQAVGLDAPLAEGDQVEIYRPLRADPSELRRRRAAQTGR